MSVLLPVYPQTRTHTCSHILRVLHFCWWTVCQDEFATVASALSHTAAWPPDCCFCLLHRLTIHAECPMHLEDFPMDAHACPLKFGSCKSVQTVTTKHRSMYKRQKKERQRKSSCRDRSSGDCSQQELNMFPVLEKLERPWSALSTIYTHTRYNGITVIRSVSCSKPTTGLKWEWKSPLVTCWKACSHTSSGTVELTARC